jgi:ABC-type sugar transport system permease subunit
VRSVVFAPVILSGAAVGLVWAYVFDPNYGLMRTFPLYLVCKGDRNLEAYLWL